MFKKPSVYRPMNEEETKSLLWKFHENFNEFGARTSDKRLQKVLASAEKEANVYMKATLHPDAFNMLVKIRDQLREKQKEKESWK